MAFSLRKMLTNISYFKKIENESVNTEKQNTYDEMDLNDYQTTEPDSTIRQCSSLNIPDSVKIFNAKKTSLSDTDLTLNVNNPIRHKHKRCKKLKLDINKASQSLSEKLNQEESCDSNVENTPKHILLECATSEFTNKLKGFDFNKEFDIYDGTSDDQWSNPFEEENIDIESFSDHSDSDISIGNQKKSIKMCRKVQSMESGSSSDEIQHPPTSPESFGDIETDKNEIERIKLLYNYQNKLEKVENLLKDMLNEFQFHIQVSKIFNRTLPDTDPGNPEIRKPSPTDSWSVIMEEDGNTKVSVKKQLESIKYSIEQFINIYLKDYEKDTRIKKCRKYTPRNKGKQRCVNKKKMKYYDFPDLREAMINLFSPELNETNSSDSDDSLSSKCSCSCHETSSHTDSGLISKNNDRSNQSITSSLGNFSLETSTLTTYSESLDQIISYNSFEDSVYNTFIQKTAVERITFYIQVHNIQLKCDLNDDNETKTLIFFCQSCKSTEYNENDLLKHILGQNHCEKIHFQYKTAYIKKCMAEGKEIQPSTVLNPMKMYRDDNKIVCFGNAVYACSLCFENDIIGESVLMTHCAEKYHIEKREKLNEIID
ncbi:PREDICTED: uncharacterized protein LOC106102994 [Papilio polytes]|uniref:uncharacterized protein LOC106102994 n=1 Tax=Papilio polytes TaxID=76194 RepID=UPI0006769979|nr:PREDICTED: uncharacterized protein LOC106102994 [Papilio polytes]